MLLFVDQRFVVGDGKMCALTVSIGWVGVPVRATVRTASGGDSYVIQGWRAEDAATLAEIGLVPAHETVVQIPKRMMQFFPEVTGGGGGDV